MKRFTRMLVGSSAVNSDSKYVRKTVALVREEGVVSISSRRGRQETDVANAEGDARAVWQGDRKYGPANYLTGGLKAPYI